MILLREMTNKKMDTEDVDENIDELFTDSKVYDPDIGGKPDQGCGKKRRGTRELCGYYYI